MGRCDRRSDRLGEGLDQRRQCRVGATLYSYFDLLPDTNTFYYYFGGIVKFLGVPSDLGIHFVPTVKFGGGCCQIWVIIDVVWGVASMCVLGCVV